MALDTLSTTIPTGSDKIAGRTTAAGFVEATILTDPSGSEVDPATKALQTTGNASLSSIDAKQDTQNAWLQSLDDNANGLRQILRAINALGMALNATGELRVAQSGGTIAAVTTVATVTTVTTVSTVSNQTLMGGISPSMDQYYASRAACAAINSRVI